MRCGLLQKVRISLPQALYPIVDSYFQNSHFYVKYIAEQTDLFSILSGVPQERILVPIIYILYTADNPVMTHTTIITHADDTALLATHDTRMPSHAV